MSMLEDRRGAEESLVLADAGVIRRQRRQMIVALGILLVALTLVLIKDWQFWFPSSSSSSFAEAVEETSPTEAEMTQEPGEPSHAKPKPRVATAQPPVATAPEVAGPTISASQRTVLPPLEVEVVAGGGQRRPLQPRNNAIKVDLQSETASASAGAPAMDASATVRLSPEAAQMVSRPVEPSYPLLAKQMKVQGAVVLQALIGRHGSIESLRVLSGPAILSSAAMEAVKQWRFKPYLQEGQPVETEARITVNFTISTY